MRKKTLFQSVPLFSLCFLLSHISFGQISHWAQRAGSAGNDESYDISIDAAGNTYTTGYFSGTATFGTTTLTANGVTDVFVAKIDSFGVYQWAIQAGGSGSDRGFSIKADASGNSYITGFYYGTATFGSSSITSSGLQDAFIAKYNTAGVPQWVRSAGGSESDIGNGINVDNSGNVLVTGEFEGIASFGSSSLTSMNSSIDVFTTKLDASGNFLWAEQGAAPYVDRGIDVASDVSGNIYVTGMFTDTITFDVTHNNTIYNAIFIIKYNSSGVEQWFKKIGGGTLNLVSGIAVDASANIYVTGDFTGNLIFFGPPNTTITNTYANRIFTAKYDSGGDFLWVNADGSDGELTSKNIALDASGNPFIIGNFKCKLNDYADQYGQGTFNSIGFWDIFVTKYSTGGAWQWSRQYGSRENDYGGGITIANTGQAIIAGSFSQTFRFPWPVNIINSNLFPVSGWYSNGYCSDSEYGEYLGFSSYGSADIVIAKIVDTGKQPYDYYFREGSGCNRPYVGVCINDYYFGYYTNCPDSIGFCGQGELDAHSYTTDAGPAFTYLWSTGSTGSYIQVNASGYYSVTQTSLDGCFVSNDSIYVTIHPIPPRPTISDDHGINTNAISPVSINLCGDSALLTGGNFGTNTHWWTGPTGTFNSVTDWATITGVYSFYDSTAFGCVNGNSVWVIIDTALTPIIPEMICWQDTVDRNDSITLCRGDHFDMYVYDSISNPYGYLTCLPNATIYWSVLSDSSIYFDNLTFSECDISVDYPWNWFQPSATGSYQITAMIVSETNCGVDTVSVTRTIYVELLPIPIITITGNPYICPGDSTLLVVSGADTYNWLGLGYTNDSLWIKEGFYYVRGTNSSGCTSNAWLDVFVYPMTQPIVTMNPSNGLICPNDSVQLFCDGAGVFNWEGPSGPIGGNTSTIFVNIPGLYYCIRTDTNGCLYTSVSNTVQVNQYGTPYILATPSTVLCPGGSVLISVVSSDTTNIQWQAPLSGNNTKQIVTSPGTYSCAITVCGIRTVSSVTITMSTVAATITADGPLTFCSGDSVVLTANSGMLNYDWQPGNISQPVLPVYQSGTYTLSTVDGYGCSATSAPITVNVNPSPNVTVDSATICNGQTATITASGATSYSWSTGATGNSITTSPTVTTPYSVTGSASGCSSSANSVVTVNQIPIVTVASPTICLGETIILSATGADTYLWSTGDINSSINSSPLLTTTYTVTGTSNSCSGTTTSVVTVIPNTASNPTVSNTEICSGDVATLTATGAGTMQWYTSQNAQTPVYIGSVYTTPALVSTTTYFVLARDQNCKSALMPVTINIEDCDNILLPNSFTPNGDGVNDQLFFRLNASCFNCKIYNRWGTLIYEWENETNGWDGTIMKTGEPASDGVYYFIISYCSSSDKKELKGFIQLLRE